MLLAKASRIVHEYSIDGIVHHCTQGQLGRPPLNRGCIAEIKEELAVTEGIVARRRFDSTWILAPDRLVV